MLKHDALNIGRAISHLWLLETICDRSADLQMDDEQIKDTRQRASTALNAVKRICTNCDIGDHIGPEISRFKAALKRESLKETARRCEHLRERILDELKGEFYFHVFRDDARHYGQKSPFGDSVATKFAAATFEIGQATKCLALRQPTACVFHLMRGMESVVRRLAKKLKLTITPRTTWRQLTSNMDAQIKKMPEKTSRQKEKRATGRKLESTCII